MKQRVSLYSTSTRTRVGSARSADAGERGAGEDTEAPAAPAAQPSESSTAKPPGRWRRMLRARERPLIFLAGLLIAGGLLLGQAAMRPKPQPLTQDDIDAAVMRTVENKVLPSQAARAQEAIAPSVVRVRGFGHDRDEDKDVERSVGSGVVILDNGTILTNLHVVSGAEKVTVVFFDGSESDAVVLGAQPENDLAVLKAKVVPDDLQPATLRSTSDLRVGDEVIAVGFPFGVGPSTSSGIVSGLRREYRSPKGEKVLTNLIQFDAAANPGSSGGPLVTMDGEVVGIVTAILSPGSQRTFIGIGFAVPIENAAAAVGMSPF